MGGKHSHDHHHSHEATESLFGIFIIAIILNLMFVIIEGAIGWIYNSMSLLSDAGHNLSDTFSLMLALLAFILARRNSNRRYTYGYKKSTILVSLLNSILLLVAVGGIIFESIDRMRNPSPIEGEVIMWTAAVGIFINGITAWLLMRRQKHDVNVRGAYLHMAMDTLVSIGVVVSGVIISYTGLYIIDSLVSLAIALIILVSTWRLLRESLSLSLDGVPLSVDIDDIERSIEEIEGVKNIHNIHIWAISTTENAATLHLLIDDISQMERIKTTAKSLLRERGVSHSTIEFEAEKTECDK
ncbi:MAG: cation diffusion facilitator family transporter [Rikenellaceae bacterium]